MSSFLLLLLLLLVTLSLSICRAKRSFSQQINNHTGHVPRSWERLVLVTQTPLQPHSSATDVARSSLLGVSTRVFTEHAKSEGRLHAYVTFTKDDLKYSSTTSAFQHLMKFYQSIELYISFIENSNSLRTTFLDSLKDENGYEKNGFDYLMYVSPTSVMLNSDLLEKNLDEESDSDTDVVYCNKLPYSMEMLIELFQYDIYSLGLKPETIRKLQFDDDSLKSWYTFCGIDVFVIPTDLLARVRKRVETIISHALVFEGLYSSKFEERWSDYFFSVIVFNMALLEENIEIRFLSVLNDVGDVPSALSSGVMIFPPPIALANIDISINSELVDVEGGVAGIEFSLPPGGIASNCETYLYGLSHIEILQEKWGHLLNDNTFCVVGSGLMTAMAKSAYLEVNSYEALLRAERGQAGRSVVLQQSCGDFQILPEIAGRSNFISTRNVLECSEHYSILPAISSLLAGHLSPSLVHINGCLDSSGSFRISEKSDKSSSLCSNNISDEILESEDPLEGLYSSLLAVNTNVLPCLVVVTPALQRSDDTLRFTSVMRMLGLIERNSSLHSAAIGPHCTHSQLLELSQLLTPDMSDALLHPILVMGDTTSAVDKGELEAFLSPRSEIVEPQAFYTFPSGGVGINLLRDTNRLATSIENCLPRSIFQLLYGRLKHRGYVALGGNSHFIPFDGSPGRSVVERIILRYLAPLVVGSQADAQKLGFIGAEWWIQHRVSGNPKEYHYDSAMTWCRENGWTQDELGHCPFYPQIGSMFYLTAEGGPTVVFDEHTFENNPVPPIPERVAIIFPQKNRMGIFRGNRYHGVMHDPRVQDNDGTAKLRLTLLVNYWRIRDVGENYTHILPHENIFLHSFEEAHDTQANALNEEIGDQHMNEDDDYQYIFRAPPREVPYTEVPVERDIMDYLEYFKNQTVAPDLYERITAAHKMKSQASDESIGKASVDDWKTPISLLSFPRNSRYSEYCNELIHNHNMSLSRFVEYTRDEESGQPIVPQQGTIESITRWRKRWPHMPEDHEQQIRDLFS